MNLQLKLPTRSHKPSNQCSTKNNIDIHYLIDLENIGHRWVDLVITTNPRARFHVFYTPKSAVIPIDRIDDVISIRDRVTFIQCYPGPNALDYQLDTQLGYMISKFPHRKFIIVSGDAGYDNVIRFWVDRGVSIERLCDPHVPANVLTIVE